MSEPIHETLPAQPLDIAIVDEGRTLLLTWTTSVHDRLDAEHIWRMCPSAAGKRRRIDGKTTPATSNLRLTAMQPIGRYAINLSFSDGHDRGIYPWAFLRELAAAPTVDDFIAA